jgi:hypothetical protein
MELRTLRTNCVTALAKVRDVKTDSKAGLSSANAATAALPEYFPVVGCSVV